MDEMLAKVATAASIIFFIGIVIMFEAGHVENTHAKADEISVKTEIREEQNTMEMNPQDNLEIPLPQDIISNNVKINADMISKTVKVEFDINDSVFDVASVVNTAQQIAQISYNSNAGRISISIVLNNYYETVWCFKDQKLYMRFIDPHENNAIVVVDPGHGDFDVGANIGSIYEKDITLEICRLLKEKVKNEPFKVYFTREDDTYPAVEERVQFSNAIRPDLFVSVHCNWYDDSADIKGTEVLYNVNDNAAKNSSYWLARIMEKTVSKACGTVDKGLVDGNSIYIVRHSEVPVALVEVGFMTNSDDLKMLTSEEGKRNAAEGICDGIVEALKEMGKY